LAYVRRALLTEGVVDRDVGWRSRVRPPTTRSAMERLEAQGPSQGPVRPRKTHRLADRKAGLREPIARLPAPPGAPFPSS